MTSKSLKKTGISGTGWNDDTLLWQTRQSSGLQPDQHQSSNTTTTTTTSSNSSSSSSSNHRAAQQTVPAAGVRTSKLGIDIKRNGVPEGHKHVSKSQMKGRWHRGAFTCSFAIRVRYTDLLYLSHIPRTNRYVAPGRRCLLSLCWMAC